MKIPSQRSVVLTLLVVVLILGVMVFQPLQASPMVSAQAPTPTPQPVQRTVSVNGAGTVNVEPDLAVIVLGVQTEAETASEALTQNNQQMQALLDTLESAGIPESNIRTLSLQLYPTINAPTPEPSPTAEAGETQNQLLSYTALNTVEVRVTDLDNVGDILDQAVSSGSNQIQSIYFDVTNPTEVLDQARETAMQDARHKAEQLAQLAGAEIGPVVSIFESSQFPVPFQGEAAAVDQAAGGVPISAGQQILTVNIQVTWELQITGETTGQ